MGQKIVLPESFTDTTLPVLRDDPLLAAGSLFLFDPSHSLGGIVGVPGVVGTSAPNVLPNVAWKQATAVLGAGTQTSLAGSVTTRNVDDSIWKVERSGKGGIHGIITQSGAQVSTRAWRATLPTAVRDYVMANMAAHQFYFSIWRKITRPVVVPNTARQSPFHFARTTSNYLFHMEGGVFAPVTGAALVGRSGIPGLTGDEFIAAGANKFMAGATAGFTGTGPTTSEDIAFGLGTFDAWGTINYNKAPSHIIYRVYAEDLTVSGRTFADASAADQALYNAAFAAGGKFFGDTYTDPATLP